MCAAFPSQNRIARWVLLGGRRPLVAGGGTPPPRSPAPSVWPEIRADPSVPGSEPPSPPNLEHIARDCCAEHVPGAPRVSAPCDDTAVDAVTLPGPAPSSPGIAPTGWQCRSPSSSSLDAGHARIWVSLPYWAVGE